MLKIIAEILESFLYSSLSSFSSPLMFIFSSKSSSKRMQSADLSYLVISSNDCFDETCLMVKVYFANFKTTVLSS
jgi:hypothetical protein